MSVKLEENEDISASHGKSNTLNVRKRRLSNSGNELVAINSNHTDNEIEAAIGLVMLSREVRIDVQTAESCSIAHTTPTEQSTQTENVPFTKKIKQATESITTNVNTNDSNSVPLRPEKKRPQSNRTPLLSSCRNILKELLNRKNFD